ncbi:hypothetical protein NliqN6_5000 [Naganishia liquefaciens]|uniref:FHA domain-containing protein n=1 Tax=Naganishia liquefaciens TaxID=104408 RepID=A0A8H3YGS3_9TREE|nr:hypothetical protein NliqN6_5000 [Naganishia liquefaciens]
MSSRDRPSRDARSRSPGGYRNRDRRQPDFARTRDNGYASRDRPRPTGDEHQFDRAGGGSRDRRYTEDDRREERSRDRRRYDEANGRDDSQPPERAKSPPKPNFANSGLLAAESNTVRVTSEQASKAGTPDVTGVVLKYHEPPEARKPAKNWRLYVFKGKEQVELIQIHKQSAYLVGRDRIVSDIPIAHPSASKQHAVIQYRQITEKNEFGDTKTMIKPFIIDLDSTNGTFVNGTEIPASRYYELKQSDVIKFGESTREYVLLHEESA